MAESFYYYGIFYLLNRLFMVVKSLIKKPEMVSVDEAFQEVSMDPLFEKSTTKDRIGYVAFLLNSIWVFAGLFTPESTYFCLLGILATLFIYVRMTRQDEGKEYFYWILTMCLRIVISSVVLYHHFFIV